MDRFVAELDPLSLDAFAAGKQIKKMIAAKGVQPGEEIVYTLSYVNSGSEAAKDVVISDPIPAGTAFIPGSASANTRPARPSSFFT